MSNELNEALAKQRALDAAKKAAEKVEKKPVVLAKTPDPKQKFVKLDKSKPEITAPKADQAVKAKISLL